VAGDAGGLVDLLALRDLGGIDIGGDCGVVVADNGVVEESDRAEGEQQGEAAADPAHHLRPAALARRPARWRCVFDRHSVDTSYSVAAAWRCRRCNGRDPQELPVKPYF